MRQRCVFILLALMNLLTISAQKIEKVHGEYTYHVPDNVSLEEGKRTALERVKIQALADAFGTLVSQSNSTIVKNENGKSSVGFLSIGGSNVKGEWIETIGEPKFDIFYESNMLTIKVTIDGKAREIKNAAIDFEAKLLRNGTEEKYESDEFRKGDDLYLYFKSPINGYLAVICWMRIRSKSFVSCHTKVLESLHIRSFTTSLMCFSLAKSRRESKRSR